MKEIIGIVGAGLVGKALATQLSKFGYTVKVANSRGPQTLRTFEQETGARAVEVSEIARETDILILAIPLKNISKLRNLILNLPGTAVVIDACNYYPWRDEQIPEINAGLTESVWVSRQLERPVIKAFNNIIAANMVTSSKSLDSPKRVALPVAGDDPIAKNIVMDLMKELGFTAFDAGSLVSSWRQQPGQPVYCTDPTISELPKLLARADKQKAKANRARIKIILSRLPPEFSGQDLTSVSRLMIGLDVFKLKSWAALVRCSLAML
ncbi:MAG: NAD(P)-binding domain-containing protein [Bacteroidota bacterium]